MAFPFMSVCARLGATQRPKRQDDLPGLAEGLLDPYALNIWLHRYNVIPSHRASLHLTQYAYTLINMPQALWKLSMKERDPLIAKYCLKYLNYMNPFLKLPELPPVEDEGESESKGKPVVPMDDDEEEEEEDTPSTSGQPGPSPMEVEQAELKSKISRKRQEIEDQQRAFLDTPPSERGLGAFLHRALVESLEKELAALESQLQ
jgi:hypothetical protein